MSEKTEPVLPEVMYTGGTIMVFLGLYQFSWLAIFIGIGISLMIDGIRMEHRNDRRRQHEELIECLKRKADQ